MKMRKKLIIFLLVAINSLVSATSNISGKLKNTYGRLYNNIFKNSKSDNTGSKSKELLDIALISKNKDLNNVYIDDNSKKPEYLEWLMFSGNFSNSNVNEILNMEIYESDYENKSNLDKKSHNQSIIPVLLANLPVRWDRNYQNDNFDEIIGNSIGTDIRGYKVGSSYIELLEEAMAKSLGLPNRKYLTSQTKAYVKGESILHNEVKNDNIHINENKYISFYLDGNTENNKNKIKLENTIIDGSAVYDYFQANQVKIIPSKIENTIVFADNINNIFTNTSYITDLESDYIGFGINYEKMLQDNSKVKVSDDSINGIINTLNRENNIAISDNNKYIFDSMGEIFDNEKELDSKDELYLKNTVAKVDINGNLELLLENSEKRFFDLFITKRSIIDNERNLLLLSEEAALSQVIKIRDEKIEIDEVEEYIPTGNYQVSSVVRDNISLLDTESETTNDNQEQTETLDMSVNYYTLSSILDNKNKHIYSYLDLGINQSANLDEIVPKAQYEKYMVNDWVLRRDLMERLHQNQLFYSSNRSGNEDLDEEIKSPSWKLKAALDFTYDFNS